MTAKTGGRPRAEVPEGMETMAMKLRDAARDIRFLRDDTADAIRRRNALIKEALDAGMPGAVIARLCDVVITYPAKIARGEVSA